MADEVRNSETESMVEALANLMGKPSNQDNPNKMRKEIIQLIRNPKFKKASEGRKTVKALRLPTGVVNLLNAKISVSAKKEILDNVVGLLNKRVRISNVIEEENSKVFEEENTNVVEEEASLPLPREEKSKSFDEEPLPTYSGASGDQDGGYFGNVAEYSLLLGIINIFTFTLVNSRQL